ncbi:homocysteine S-methyltransferase [Algoriphagus sediminis]|uniref:Homocysteine S-methyltransferase n=1 Tax=Algoriphagus sediminis TaxID=3057113 RepID=A0ABT7YA22_9BACT|nr:homocysteine S-methyltransferase [Algoriphagus sediminis]MDN3203349.1 homocysteine S-methyltransferase [Algoriphagus sediminis]
MTLDLNQISFPLILDGGLSNVLESQGNDLNHKLWTAKLLVEKPEALIQTHYEYIKAGAQIITTSSYQVSGQGLLDLGFPAKALEALLLKSIELVQSAILRAEEQGLIKQRPLIAASLGPYGAYLADGSEYRGNYQVSEKVIRKFHQERIEILDNSESDFLAFETIPSFGEAKVLSEILREAAKPSWVSFSCKSGSEINDGTQIELAIELFRDHPAVFAIGVNCTKPKYISELIKRIKKGNTGKRIIVYPNSGEAFNATNKTWMGTADPNLFVEMAKEWIDLGADIIGGCCRIGPGHISQLRDKYLKG